MKKKILLVLAIISMLVCMLAVSVSAQRVEDYNDTYTLVKTSSIQQIFRRYTDETNFSRTWFTDTITVKFVNENGVELDEVPLWEYDEANEKYYSLVWYISEWSFVTEKEDVTYNEVTTQRDKYISAVYTLSKARAVDLRFDTSYSENKSFSTSSVGYDYSLTISKPLWGIFYDVNNTPSDTSDDIKLQQSTGMGRDTNDYNCIGFEAQFAAIGNKIVVANFRDCTGEDFDADCTGNYGTKTTWYLATNLQCLHYHDEFKYMVSGIGPVYEIDLGDGLEVINCQLLRDNKRIETLVLPNSLIYLGGESFRGSSAKTITIGEGLLYSPSNVNQWKSGAFENMYISKNLLTTYKGYFTKYEGNGTSLLASLGTSNLYFDGDLEQATTLMNRMIEENSGWSGKITLVDYKTTQERGDVKNVCLFYNYNRCEAFYRGQHDDKETLEYQDAVYLSQADLCTECDKCGNKTIKETYDQLFKSIGYSYSSNAVLQGFAINKSVLDNYKAYYNADIEFGIVAALSDNVTNGEILNATNKATVDFTEKEYDIFEMKISNISDANKEKSFFLCAYVTIGDKTYYLNKDTSSIDATDFAITYNSVSKDAESTPITK